MAGNRVTHFAVPMVLSLVPMLLMLSSSVSASQTGFTGWSNSPTVANAAQSAISPDVTPIPQWSNGSGCSSYYTGPGEMNCKDSSVSTQGFQIAIRTGFWNGAIEKGFGWAKALEYHNLDMQPIIDTIRLSINISGSNSARRYEVYHYTHGVLDQEVLVYADVQDNSWGGASTPDGRDVGVVNGYCENAGGAAEPECPDWVNSSL